MTDTQPDTPLVSVVIPLHDRAGELPQTLDSLRAQTYPHWEALVVDDHSKDDGPAVVEAANREDGRIKLLRLPDGRTGGPAGRNFGADHAAGAFVIFLDSDDLLAPFALEQRVRVMRQNPHLGFAVFGAQLFRDEAGDIPLLWNCFNETDDLDRFLARECVWQTTGPIWRRGAMEVVGPWDETILSGQDWEYHVRALLQAKQGRVQYQKFGPDQGFAPADLYWRIAGPDRASIGKSALGTAHARARLKVLDDMLEKVRAAGELTDYRRTRFAVLYWQAVEYLANRCNRREGRRVWAEVCRRTGFFTRAQRVAGAAHLFLGRFAQYRTRVGDAALRRAWPAELFFSKSPTYLAAPADPSRPPMVSFLLCAADAESTVGQALRGAIRQREHDWELIYVDAGATDNTAKLVRRAADQDCRMRTFKLPKERRGPGAMRAALELALAESRGEFVARIDAADASDQFRLLRQTRVLKADPECVAVGAQIAWKPLNGAAVRHTELPTSHDAIDAALLSGDAGAILPAATLVRRNALDRAGGYRADSPAAPDPALFLRLAELGTLANLPSVEIESRRDPAAAPAAPADVQEMIHAATARRSANARPRAAVA